MRKHFLELSNREQGNALIKYKGGVILVSHDERLLKMVCQELWVCSRVQSFFSR
jgi:ATPase subunit of ABC transporter with duplicated ATPase domains